MGGPRKPRKRGRPCGRPRSVGFSAPCGATPPTATGWLASYCAEYPTARPTAAPIVSPTRCSTLGTSGARRPSQWASAITARRIGLGMPFLFVLPSAASPNMVSISASNCSAGVT